jgi:hypothetical protein
MLPCDLIRSDAVARLSHADYRVLTLLAAEYQGHNNGAIGLTFEQARRAGIGQRRTFYGALRALAAAGLIERTYPPSRTPPRPTMWALAWWPANDTEYTRATRTASHDYRTATPPEKNKNAGAPTALKVVHLLHSRTGEGRP